MVRERSPDEAASTEFGACYGRGKREQAGWSKIMSEQESEPS